MQDHPADQLNIVVTHAHESTASFATRGKGFDQDVIQCFAVAESLFELLRLFAEFCVAERHHSWFEFTGLPCVLGISLDLSRICRPEKRCQPAIDTTQNTIDCVGSAFPNFFQQIHFITSCESDLSRCSAQEFNRTVVAVARALSKP